MKTQEEIEQMLAILQAFGQPESVKALEWVLGRYPKGPQSHIPSNDQQLKKLQEERG